MNETTLKFCYYASELYESKKLSANQIYELLIKSKSRKDEVSRARQLISYMLYNHCNMTMVQIAKELNLKNHSSILYQIDQVYFSLRTDKRMQYRVNFMVDIFNGVYRTITRDTPISKGVLSDDDKEFIKTNAHKGYSISYFSDVLNKNKGSIKFYLRSLNIDSLNASRKVQVNLPKFANKQIDY